MGCWQSQTVRNLLLQHLNSLSFQKWAGNLQGTFALGCQEVWGSDLVLGHSVFFPIPVLSWGYQTERLFLQEIPQSWGGTSAPLEVLHSHTLFLNNHCAMWWKCLQLFQRPSLSFLHRMKTCDGDKNEFYSWNWPLQRYWTTMLHSYSATHLLQYVPASTKCSWGLWLILLMIWITIFSSSPAEKPSVMIPLWTRLSICIYKTIHITNKNIN